MHEVLVNRLGGLSLPRKSVVRLTDRPDMTLDVYRGGKTTIQQQQLNHLSGLPVSLSTIVIARDDEPCKASHYIKIGFQKIFVLPHFLEMHRGSI